MVSDSASSQLGFFRMVTSMTIPHYLYKKNPKEEVETGTSRDETGKEIRSNHIQTFHLILLIIIGKKRKEKDSIPSDCQCTIK
jgi:hypothetical protein